MARRSIPQPSLAVAQLGRLTRQQRRRFGIVYTFILGIAFYVFKDYLQITKLMGLHSSQFAERRERRQRQHHNSAAAKANAAGSSTSTNDNVNVNVGNNGNDSEDEFEF
jgi:archaellum component FlaF (FlaF/FlaG flagellin family)